MSARAVAASIVAAIVMVAPGVAAACPFCASSSPGSGGVRTLVLGMLALPFLVAGLILRAVLRTSRDLKDEARLAMPSLEER